MPVRRSYVYFVQCSGNGLVKIGVTREPPNKRFAELSRVSPVSLAKLGVVRGTLDVERRLHVRFHEHRHHGEWFEPAPALMEFIREYAQPWPEVPDDSEGDRRDRLDGVWRRHVDDVLLMKRAWSYASYNQALIRAEADGFPGHA